MTERITALIVKFPGGICIDCLGLLSGHTLEFVHAALGELRKTVQLVIHDDACPKCDRSRPVVRIVAPT